MSKDTLLKIDKLEKHIQTLEAEKEILKQSLRSSLLEILDQHAVFNLDFETLLGGILSVAQVIKNNHAPDQEQLKTYKAIGQKNSSIKIKKEKLNPNK